MARTQLLIPALTVCAMLSASPLASADSQFPGQHSAAASSSPAMNVNMLDMSMCGEREQVVAELSQQFKEKPMAIGQVDSNAVVEILVSETGSWTILATGTDGQSCIVSAGEGFQSTTMVRGIDA